MSLPRAYVNCMRCYEVARNVIAGSGVGAVVHNDSAYTARNEALGALEEVLRESDNKTAKELASSGLQNCMSCAYESPLIAHLILSSIQPKGTDK